MPQRLGRYQVVGALGVGGMAEILLGRLVGPSGFERPVVLKRILPHLSRQTSFVNMFLDEARIVSSIRHRNVVQVHELVHEGDDLFMVMEYLEGESVASLLKRRLKRNEPPDAALGAYVIAEAAAGLHAAHELLDAAGVLRDVVHRDVSPQNLFVTYDGDVKVLDFGIAKAADRLGDTESGVVKGKFAYMSPEQCRGEPIDRRSDIFSLGTVLFEITTGRALFTRGSHVETLRAIEVEPIVPPSRVVSAYPPRLEAICMKALGRNRDDRYATAEELRRDLLAVVRSLTPDGEPDRALASVMHGLFPDRAEEKHKMLQRIGAGSSPSMIPPGDADADVAIPSVMVRTQSTTDSAATRLETPASKTHHVRRRHRSVLVAGGLFLVAVVGVSLAMRVNRQTAPPVSAPAASVVVSNLRFVWTTSNSIRWEWDVNDVSPDKLAYYEMVTGPTETDVLQRANRAVVWGANRSPELSHYLLERTGAVEKVLGTTTHGHEPSTDQYGQVVAVDNTGRRSQSLVVRARTTFAVEEVPLLGAGEQVGAFGYPDLVHIERSSEGGWGLSAVICCDDSVGGKFEVCDRKPVCYENLRVEKLKPVPPDLLVGTFQTTAFLEFTLTTDSTVPSTWSEVWLSVGPGKAREKLFRYGGMSFAARENGRVVQLPLRVLANWGKQALSFDRLREAQYVVSQFNVGGTWTAGAHVRIDRIRIRW